MERGEMGMLMGDIMTPNVPLLAIDATLEQAVKMLRRSKADGLPVVDDQGRLAGIFTKANLMNAFLAGATPTQSIAPYYQKNVGTVRVDTPYEVVEDLVKTSPVGTGVVVDADNNVVGIFTKVDMIMSLFRKTETLAGHLRTVYDSMHNGVIVVDNDLTIRLFNQPAAKILSLEQENVLGRSFPDLFPGIDLMPVIGERQWLIGVKAGWKETGVMCNISPLVSEKGVQGAIVIFQPLTELDQIASELETTKSLYETLTAVLNIAYEAIVLVDELGNISLVNEAACRFFRRRQEELLGKAIEEVMPKSRLLRTLKTGMAETNEVQVIDGQPCIVSRNPIVRHGKVIGAVGKITYQRLEEVRELSEKLAEMDRELDYYRAKAQEARNLVTFNQIVTVNKAMRNIKEEAEMVARGNSTVMLTGESGTGKELFAEAIHNASLRRRGPFVQVNCAAIPEPLAESELFGYAPGAFTGARRAGKPGKFLMADGGTLFLDEIGDMPLNLQAKLLRFLEDQSVNPVGGTEVRRVNVRIITATNQDLWHKVEAGSFRRDLYYRLNVINFQLLPLRERPEDIIPLANLFLEKYSEAFGLHIEDIAPDARSVLIAHSWPGNVRELRNVMERAVNYASGPILDLHSLPYYLQGRKEANISNVTESKPAPRPKGSLDREAILQVLNRYKGNKSATAKALGISRSWLYEKLRRYDLL
jgi:transcriptional regulator with PAS, ATPase and Fis domain